MSAAQPAPPATLRAGIAFRPAALLTLAGDAAYPMTEARMWAAGAVELTPVRLLSLRGGYRWSQDNQHLKGLSGVVAGLGIRLGSFGIDYAYQPFGDLTTSHRVAVVYTGSSAGSRSN